MAITETEHGWYSCVITNSKTEAWAYVEVKAKTQQEFMNKLSTLIKLNDLQVTQIQRIT